MAKVAAFGSLLAAVTLIASCSGSGASAPRPTATSGARATLPQSSAAAPQTTAPTSKTFTSATYGYTLTLPAQWSTVRAQNQMGRPLGMGRRLIQRRSVYRRREKLVGHRGAVDRDLAACTTFLITANYRYHGEFCPLKPKRKEPRHHRRSTGRAARLQLRHPDQHRRNRVILFTLSASATRGASCNLRGTAMPAPN